VGLIANRGDSKRRFCKKNHLALFWEQLHGPGGDPLKPGFLTFNPMQDFIMGSFVFMVKQSSLMDFEMPHKNFCSLYVFENNPMKIRSRWQLS